MATQLSKVFDCSDIHNFTSTIVEVLPFFGYSKPHFYTCEVQGVRFLTKMCLYRKSISELYVKSGKNVIPQNDAEVRILQLFKKKFIERGITPCILELEYVKICEDMSKLIPDEDTCNRLTLDMRVTPEEEPLLHICKHADLIKRGLANNKCSFLVLERCDISIDIYLQRNINMPVSVTIFKSIIFMIIYTLFAITRTYPGFHHYDLHTGNIMLKFDRNYKFKPNKPMFLVFQFDGEEYHVPYFGIIPKIIDFGFSVVPEEGIISDVTEDKNIMFTRIDNDVILLFHHIYHIVDMYGADRLEWIDKIFRALDPTRSYVHFYTEYIRKIESELPTYEDMIKNKVFNDYKKYRGTADQIYKTYRC